MFVRPTHVNAVRVVAALAKFGAPLAAHGIQVDDFVNPKTVYQLGLPPRRIDFMTGIDGVAFDAAWQGRVSIQFRGHTVFFLGLSHLIQNKKAAGRAKDLADIERLTGTKGKARKRKGRQRKR